MAAVAVFRDLRSVNLPIGVNQVLHPTIHCGASPASSLERKNKTIRQAGYTFIL
jgi:hypothetical protein